LLGLCAALALSGAGSSTQHPIALAAVSRPYGTAARGPLGTYNFSGDLGKAAIPALIALLLTLMAWRASLWLLAALGFAVAVVIAVFLPPHGQARAGETARLWRAEGAAGSGCCLQLECWIPPYAWACSPSYRSFSRLKAPPCPLLG
jgi:MFS transporter, FSR family, fosmidomycin resistance protein